RRPGALLSRRGPSDTPKGGRRAALLRAASPRDGQLDSEDRPGPFGGLHVEAAVHPPCELAGDVEAEARAADAPRQFGVEAVELLEDPRVLLGGDAEAGVHDGEAHGRLVARDPDA